MLEDEPPAAKGPPNWTPPISLFKKMQLKYAKMPMEKGRENLKKKWKKRKGVFL